MQNAPQPREERAIPVTQVTELIDGSETTPISEQVVEIRNTIARLKTEIELCEAFLQSGNVIDGPNMDKNVEIVESRVKSVRNALKTICELNIGDPDFEKKFRQIKNEIFLAQV